MKKKEKGENKMGIGRSYLLNHISNMEWMMQPTVLNSTMEVIKSKFTGDIVGQLNSLNSSVDTEIVELIKSGEKSIAVLNIEGVLVPKASFIEKACMGLTPTHELRTKFNELVEDSTVDKIILNLDSPGGTTTGIREFAEAIYEARDKKEIVAYSNTIMCSAGYYIASAASKVYASPSALTVNIGSYITIIKEKENSDFDVHIFSKGDLKTAGHPNTEMTEEEKNFFTEMVDESYNQFVTDVAKYRGLDTRVVEDTKSRFYKAEQVLGSFIDGLMTEDELI